MNAPSPQRFAELLAFGREHLRPVRRGEWASAGLGREYALVMGQRPHLNGRCLWTLSASGEKLHTASSFADAVTFLCRFVKSDKCGKETSSVTLESW